MKLLNLFMKLHGFRFLIFKSFFSSFLSFIQFLHLITGILQKKTRKTLRVKRGEEGVCARFTTVLFKLLTNFLWGRNHRFSSLESFKFSQCSALFLRQKSANDFFRETTLIIIHFLKINHGYLFHS